MLRWIANALTSSVGRKIVLGLTGLLLVGFLFEHLHGNLKLYEGDGEAFVDYVNWLQGYGWLLRVAEFGLLGLFVAHIVIALRLTLENREARRTGYVVRSSTGKKTAASASMFVTGALLIAFLIKHLLDFRFHHEFFDDPSGEVREHLASPGTAAIYILAALVLGLHLSHGFRSAFQSIGASHPKLDPILEKLGPLVAALLALGFASFPVYFLFFGGK
ncbi:MAG TPA: succinate dehydrogenase cytochrome b subunit [Planctomycetes bacterium]|nr:succinate dehydrogenase cytochrome b subunit [Planctomycetota bacterium]